MIDFIIYNRKFEQIAFISNDTPNGINYEDDELTTSVETGVYTLQIKFPKSADLKPLAVGNYLSTYTPQNKLLFLTITDIDEDAIQKSILCEDTAINVLNSYVDAIQKPTAPEQLEYYAKHALEGSGIQVKEVQEVSPQLVEFGQSQRRLARLQAIAASFGTELEFTVDFKVGKPPIFYVSFLKKRTEDDQGFRLSTDDFLNGITRRINNTNIATRIRPLGADISRMWEEAQKQSKSGGSSSSDVKPRPQSNNKIEKVIEIAMSKRGRPYVWGANGPNSFDCSGFVNYCFKNAGYTNWPKWRCVTNTYWKGAYPFQRVARGSQQRGDLVLMDTGYTYPGDANHVGIYLGNGQMIHAGNPVQVQKTAGFTVLGYVRVIQDGTSEPVNNYTKASSGLFSHLPTIPSRSQVNYGFRAPGYPSHRGTDIVYLDGSSDVFAVGDGRVEVVHSGCRVGDRNCGYTWGNYVRILHPNGYRTLYAHLAMPRVQVGQQVKGGQVIGVMGNTGNSTGKHLHLELFKPGGTTAAYLVDAEKNMDFSGYKQLFK